MSDAPTPGAVMDPVLAMGIAQAQRLVRAAVHDARNTHHGFTYASSEEVITVARDALTEAGLAWVVEEERIEMFSKETSGVAGGAAGLLYLVVALVATGNGAKHPFATVVPICPGQGRPMDKALLGARTEGVSYALRDALLIPRRDADDISNRNDGSTRQRGNRPEARDVTQTIADIEKVDGIPKLVGVVQQHRAASAATTTDEEAARLEEAFVSRAVVIIGAYDKPEQVTKASAMLRRFRPTDKGRAERIDRAMAEGRARTGSAS